MSALSGEIQRYLGKGYRVQSETNTSAQLVKPKRVSVLWTVLTGGLYLVYHILFKKERSVYLRVEPDGSVRKA